MSISKKTQEALRLCYNRGWLTRRDGNISYRENTTFYITPSSIDKTGEFCMIKGELLNGLVKFESGALKASIETELHLLTHNWRKKESTCAVVHVHPTYTIAAMRSGIKLDKITQEFPELRRYTRVGQTVSYYEPGSEDLAIAVANSLRYSDICGMINHGVTAVGTSIDEALEHIERLEHIAKIVLLS